MSSLLIILILDVHVKGFYILGLSIRAELVKGKIVVCKLTFKFANILDKSFVFPLKSQVVIVILVDILYFLFHFLDLTYNIIVLGLQQVEIVGSIINLSARTLIDNFDS